ncbi:hypothetical protein AK830_g7971 [Neonectria ditissima]|uniref:Uncharacterized protein n=1 Tax=Neonectria ditissima TaxID=78410 RepID=A0A0P7AVL4_9HYPO|nr:hypothetical protein AK830_g7971 [Neonectria ditissima]
MSWKQILSSSRRRSSASSSDADSIDMQKEALLGPWPIRARPLMRLLIRVFTLLLAIVTVSYLSPTQSPEERLLKAATGPLAETTFSDNLHDVAAGQRRFVIVIPADSPNPDLCKLIASAIALGYPSPVVVNWAQPTLKSEGGFWGPYLGKISGTLDYLDRVTLPDASKGDGLDDEDIVLVVDAYDVWFQLPPDVLLQRYHDTNKRANARLAQQWGTPDGIPMKQTIVVSAQKRCFPTPKGGSNLHCDALPASDLPPGVYGAKTDTNAKNYHTVRPRYVNSGSFMGPAGDMKRYFRRVKERMEKGLSQDLAFPGDQGIFAEIFGEQEVWRQWRREDHKSAFGGLPDSEGAAFMQRDYEFHVGLDYTQNLFLPTVYEEDDGVFVALDNKTVVERHSAKLGISPARLLGVPKDMVGSYNPLEELFSSEPGAGAGPGWGEMPVYADFYTTAVPVVLHHNAWKHGLKERRVWWWDQTWFFPHLRPLLELHMRPGKLRPLARLPARSGYLEYYAPRSDAEKRKPRAFSRDTYKQGFAEIELGAVCKYEKETDESEKHWYDEVFRDDKGPF